MLIYVLFDAFDILFLLLCAGNVSRVILITLLVSSHLGSSNSIESNKHNMSFRLHAKIKCKHSNRTKQPNFIDN